MTGLIGLAALCALAYLPMTGAAPGLVRTLVKTAAVALLAVAAELAGAPGLLVLALVLCALGDALLSRDGEAAFLVGVGAFAAGHMAYVALFLLDPASDPGRLFRSPGLGTASAMLLFGALVARLIVPRAGGLAGAVAAYIPVILAMGLAAASLPPEGALAWVLPAAVAFMASDTLLAAEKFVMGADHRLRRATGYAIWTLYWLAQAGFMAAFAGLAV